MSMKVGELYWELGIRGDVRRDLRQVEDSAKSLDRNVERVDKSLRDLEVGPKARQSASRAESAVEDVGKAGDRADSKLKGMEVPGSFRQSAGRAEDAVKSIGDAGEEAGGKLSGMLEGLGERGMEAGGNLGGGIMEGIIGPLSGLASKAGPIGMALGGVAALGLGAGALLASQMQAGMEREAHADKIQAALGINEATMRVIGQASARAYTSAWGESVEANMETAQAAIQAGVLNGEETAADMEPVIENLTMISEIMGEEIPAVSRTAGQMIRNGIAADGAEAFDILTKAQQNGLNVSEDLLDTMDEYSTKFRDLGLTGPEALGLIQQSLQGGARDMDYAADALKEFQIRATDGSKASAEAFDLLGLNAEEMTAKIAAGGAGAREGLDEVLDGLRGIEDPAERTAAAVGLFGTKAEDLGEALFSMDLETAALQFGEVEGAASRAAQTMGDNAATAMESAKRSIEVTLQGLQGALAQAFGPAMSDLATQIQSHQPEIITALTGVATLAIDMGEGFLRGSAMAIRAWAMMQGEVVTGSGAVIESIGWLVEKLGQIASVIPGMGGLGEDLEGIGRGARTLGEGLRNSEETALAAADAMDAMADKLPGVRDQILESGAAATASAELYRALGDDVIALPDEVGIRVDALTDDARTRLQALGFDVEAIPGTTESRIIAVTEEAQAKLDAFKESNGMVGLEGGGDGAGGRFATAEVKVTAPTVEGVAQRLTEVGIQATSIPVGQVVLKDNSPETVARLNGVGIATTTLPGGHVAITDTSEENLERLDLLNLATTTLETGHVEITDTSDENIERLEALGVTVTRLPDGRVFIEENSEEAARNIDRNLKDKRTTGYHTVIINTENRASYRTSDGQVHNVGQDYADGGIRTIDSLPSDATIKSPTHNLVQWAEPETGGEAFIPLAQSKRGRSEKILSDVANRFGYRLEEFAEGGLRATYDLVGTPYTFGGFSPAGVDCSAYGAVIANEFTGRPAYSERMATGSARPFLQARGFREGPGRPGDLQYGWVNGGPGGGHMAMTLPDGRNAESASGIGAHIGGSTGALHPMFNEHMHLPVALSDEDVQNAFSAQTEGLMNMDTQEKPPRQLSKKEERAFAVIQEGRKRGISEKGIKIALATVLTEAGPDIKMWANAKDPETLKFEHDAVGDDGLSGGIFQQQANGAWGTAADRMDPTKSAGMFYEELAKFDYDSMEMADAAQRVQQSAFADGSNYRENLRAADELYKSLSDYDPSGSSSRSSGSVSSSPRAPQDVFVTNWPSSIAGAQAANSKREQRASAAITFYADGDVRNNHEPQIARGGDYRVWAEEETHGESYIPHNPAKRARSIKLLRQTAQILGVTEFADGGFSGYTSSAARRDTSGSDTIRNALFALGAGANYLMSGWDSDGSFKGFSATDTSASPFQPQIEDFMKRVKEGPLVLIETANINKPEDFFELVKQLDPTNAEMIRKGL